MKTNDFNKKITSDKINENMFKKFGMRVNFEKYTREELENYRNLLRTKLSQTESSTKFNELLANESYQKDKYMMNLLNTRIKEMLGESRKTDKKIGEKAVSKAQQKAAGIALAAKKAGKKPAGKGASAEMAKMSTKELEKFARTKHKGLPEKKAKKVKESAKPDYIDIDKDGDKKEPMKKAAADAKKKMTAKQAKFFGKKKIKENTMHKNYKVIIESLRHLIAEDEEGKAKDITAGVEIVNDFTSWMQRIGQYQTKTSIELADSIRANFSQAEAENFKNSIAPALQDSLQALTQTREAIARAVAALAGEKGFEEPMGGELGREAPAAPDQMNVPVEPGEDEFGASDAAAGGSRTSGREMRESRILDKVQKVVESHSIISKLAK